MRVRALVADAIAAGKRVLGICLGAQLMARALGARVSPMGYKEIGWFPVRVEADRHPLFPALRTGQEFPVAHWHGDRFDLPAGCDRIFSSEACREQGFAVRGKPAVGLQFHLELDPAMLRAFQANGGDELAEGGTWVQPAEEALRGLEREGAAARSALVGLVAAMTE
jgi:GMP synthase-like glutamine amidotransferase